MKKLKILLVLIILALLGFFIYQNVDYFMTEKTVGIHFRSFQWTSPELPVLVYWGICFAIGFLIAGIRGFAKSFVLSRELKKKNLVIQEQEIKISDLETRINDLTSTPMIMAPTSENAGIQEKEQESDATENAKADEKPAENPEEQSPEPPATPDGDMKKD